MADATNMKTASTTKSGLGILLLVVAAVAIIGLIVWALTNPDILQTTVNVIIVIGIAILVIVLIISGLMLILAVPYYMKKGEQYQDGVDYSIDDVKPVKESSSEDKKNE
ncbi:MAG: hypothetical protein E7Z65_00905 [Thermoplasmata archaeon]|jgi:heme/copper-type cytochrome/quinol oxidase subunit 2|nr:hypothetical protein [Thermoplasmata archaeon]